MSSKNTTVTTKSGLKGWQGRLCDQYANLDEFLEYDETYGIASRLGFESPRIAWKQNPLVQGSVHPDDYCRVIAPDSPPTDVTATICLKVESMEPGKSLPVWQIQEAVEQALEHAIRYGEKNGHVHDWSDKISIQLGNIEEVETRPVVDFVSFLEQELH